MTHGATDRPETCPAGPRTGIKICGIREPHALNAAIESDVDWVGFVFFARSPRFVTPRSVAQLVRGIGATSTRTVGLFVRASDEIIENTLAETDLDILQVYDTPDRALEIRQRFARPVWLSCAVAAVSELPGPRPLDGYVIEPRAPAQSALPGGNGVAMDWNLLGMWQTPMPWMLAGGLTPGNVAEALRVSHAPAVDVSSGVERAPGEKSPALIRNFVKNVRSSCAAPKR